MEMLKIPAAPSLPHFLGDRPGIARWDAPARGVLTRGAPSPSSLDFLAVCDTSRVGEIGVLVGTCEALDAPECGCWITWQLLKNAGLGFLPGHFE